MPEEGPENLITIAGNVVSGQINTGSYTYIATNSFTRINSLRVTPSGSAGTVTISYQSIVQGSVPVPIDPIGLSVGSNNTFYDDSIGMNLGDSLIFTVSVSTYIYFFITNS
jgi:hypothetical protein